MFLIFFLQQRFVIFIFMNRSLSRKIGIAIIMILTSLALVIPSVAILFEIYKSFTSPQPITIDPTQISIETTAPVSVEVVSPTATPAQ